MTGIEKACIPCRSAKRRCDRQKPECALCLRKKIRCFYTRNESLPSPSPALTEETNTTLEISDSDIPRNTAIYFLDSNLFSRAELSLPLSRISRIPNFQELVGDNGAIRAIANVFFRTVHTWLPIISKQRFFHYLLNPLSQKITELHLVVLSMKLIATTYDASTPSLYKFTKHAIQDAISAGQISIHALQASILVTAFEIGHALYPDAYLSIGYCARLGLALGIDKTIYADMDVQWPDREEARRVWWSVLILDRVVAFGCPKRPISTPMPELTSILPIDDELWDQMGRDTMRAERFRLGSASSLELGRFGRFAQSTRLLNQTLLVLGSEFAEESQGEQLSRTLIALCKLNRLEEEGRGLEFCTQSAVCLSAILLLSTHEDLHLRRNTSAVSQWQTLHAKEALSSIQFMLPRLLESTLESISPLVIHMVYKCATLFLNDGQEPIAFPDVDDLDQLRAVLQHLNVRWRSAGAYLEILTAMEETMPRSEV